MTTSSSFAFAVPFERALACQTRVTLTCARCRATVAPCDACGALRVANGRRNGNGERSAHNCAKCGAVCASGDMLRARCGMEPVEGVDPVRAVEMVMASGRGWTRAKVLTAKRERLKSLELEMATVPFVDRPPLCGATNRARKSSTTTDETGTPNERERECRRLTLSSVQCGQRAPPDSTFKTPGPTSRLGHVTTVPNSAEPSVIDDAVSIGDKIDGEIMRLKYQISHLERSTRRKRAPLRDFVSLDHDILRVTLKRAKIEDADANATLNVAGSFLDERELIQQTMDRVLKYRVALEYVDRDVRALNNQEDILGKESASNSDKRDDGSDLDVIWPKVDDIEELLPGYALLKSALVKRLALAEKYADELAAVHLNKLGEITRTQNDLFATIDDADVDANTKTAAQSAVHQLTKLYATIFKEVVTRREGQLYDGYF